MKFSILFLLAHVGSTSGQNQQAASSLRQMESKRKMNEESKGVLSEHLAHIGEHAWTESVFSTEDYEEAKEFMKLVKEDLKNHDQDVEELDEEAVLTQLFPNINMDESEKDTVTVSTPDRRLFEVNSAEEIDDFMTIFEGHVAKFPYDEALEKSKELDLVTINEIYNQEGITMENRESSINVYTIATFFEEKGIITGEHASLAKDFYLTRHERSRKLSACTEAQFGYVANVIMLMLAIFSVPTQAASKAAATLGRVAMRQAAKTAVKDLAKGFAQGLTAGLVANFVDKIVCGTMSASTILSAVNDALSSWWTWLWFGAELAITLAAFFLSGGWYLAVKLLSLVVAAAQVIQAAIGVINKC